MQPHDLVKLKPMKPYPFFIDDTKTHESLLIFI